MTTSQTQRENGDPDAMRAVAAASVLLNRLDPQRLAVLRATERDVVAATLDDIAQRAAQLAAEVRGSTVGGSAGSIR